MHGVGRGFFHAEFQVESTRLFVFCVDQKRSSADGFGSANGAAERVPKQSLAVALSLLGLADRKPSHENDRHGITSLSFHNSGRSIFRSDRRGREAVVADHAVAACENVGPGAAARLVLQGVLDQEIIERWFAAIESGSLMGFGEQNRRA